jgi:SAM-dependent methyltransferase
VSEHDEGYFDDIAYTYGYCDELNPLRLKLPLILAGLALPTIHTACELGFGHGVSVNIHAAGSTTRWYGTDFNPSHSGFAQKLADGAGSQAQLSAERFSAFCQRDDLPDFDYIGMHGIWTWISESNRAIIVDFIRRKLKAGGVLYISYNAQPGWTAMLPVRELMHQHFEVNTDAAADERVAAAVAFAQAVFATQPGYASVNPQLAERVHALSGEDASYLAHEYFNRDWQPTSFSQVASSLGPAGLTFAGSAHYRDHIDELNLTSAQRTLLSGIDEVGLQQTVRDFCMNQSFRRDYWVKRQGTLSDAEQQAALHAHRVILALPRTSVVLKTSGALGEATLPEALYGAILDALTHYRPATLKHIGDHVRRQNIATTHLAKAVMLLISMGVLLNAQDDEQIDAARPSAARLNAAICEQARRHGELQFLVSPVSCSGIRVPRLAQLFLLARRHHLTRPEQWAEFAGAAQRASPSFASAAAIRPTSHADLMGQANRFAEIHLPILEALGVA